MLYTCRVCQESLGASEFYFRATTKKLGTECRTCAKRRGREYREKNKAKIAATLKRYYDKHKDHVLAKNRARAKDPSKRHQRGVYQKRSMLKKLGVTETYEQLLTRTNNVCELSGERETATLNGALKRLTVDHCHGSGKFRGLIKNTYNRALGMFRDDPVLLTKAIIYLSRHASDGQQMLTAAISALQSELNP